MVYLGLLITCLIGWILLPPKLELGFVAKLSFSFAAGVAALSVQMFAYGLAGLAWSTAGLLLPWAGVAALAAYRHRAGLLRPIVPFRAPKVSALDVPLFLLVLIPVLIWLPYERLMPMTAWDAWAIWLLKAKAFYLDGNLSNFLGRHREFVNSHPGYPLLVPLHATFLFVLQGGVADYAVKLFSPCSFAALLGVFHHFARRWAGNTVALVFTAMAAATPMLGSLAFEYAGYAGSTLSLFLLTAAGFLYEWYRDRKLLNLAGASVAATAAAWTKNEGQFFLLGVLLIATAGLLFRRQRVRAWLLVAAPPVAVLVPWFLTKQSYGIQATEFIPGLNLRWDLFLGSLPALLDKAFDTDLFVLTFVLFAATLIAAKPLGAPWRVWLLPALVFWQLLGALLAYASGINDIEWWLATSADRVVAQIAPVALLAPVALVSHWLSREAPEEPPASVPRAGQKTKRRRKGRSS